MTAKILLTLVSILSIGCSSVPINRYATSAHNVSVLRKSEHKKINVGKFQDAQDRKKIGCRGLSLSAPDDDSFAAYIQKALVSDLMMADIFDINSDVTLTAVIDKLELKSTSGANWDIELTINSSNGRSIKLAEIYKFESAFNGDEACRNASQAFVPAVQNLISKLVRSPEFSQLVR